MAPDLSPEAWAQIRYDYEWTDRPIPDICAEHGISSGTLRDRMRHWNWTRRRQPIPAEGPPPSAPPFAGIPPQRRAPLPEPLCCGEPDSVNETGEDTGADATAAAAHGEGSAGWIEDAPAPGDDGPAAIVPRLQTAVSRVLPAIEAAVAKLGAGPAHPREMERAARVLTALTRTLRELSALLDAHQSRAPAGRICDCDDVPEDIDEFRRNLAYRIDAFVRSRTGGDEAATPQDT